MDRALRKEAGNLNAKEGRLAYIVCDFDIVKLKYPRDLPRRHDVMGNAVMSSVHSPMSGEGAPNVRNDSRTPVRSFASPLSQA